MFLLCNKNPNKKVIKNNVVSAVAILFCLSWKTTKSILEYIGSTNKEDYDSIANLDIFLHVNNYRSNAIERANKHSKCTIDDFINKHKKGCYMLLLSDHVVPVIDGVYYDYYDSKDESVIMYWSDC